MDHRKGSTCPVAHLIRTKNLRQSTAFISAVVPGAHERKPIMSIKTIYALTICAVLLFMPTVSAEMKPDIDTAELRIEQDTDSILLATSAEDGAALRSLLRVKETKFHHNDAILTMNLPQYTQPFSYHPAAQAPLLLSTLPFKMTVLLCRSLQWAPISCHLLQNGNPPSNSDLTRQLQALGTV